MEIGVENLGEEEDEADDQDGGEVEREVQLPSLSSERGDTKRLGRWPLGIFSLPLSSSSWG